LIHFLLAYDHAREKLVYTREFSDAAEAAEEYTRLEQRHRDDTQLEIVLLGADSIETIKMTHGNYFDGEGPVASPHAAAVS